MGKRELVLTAGIEARIYRNLNKRCYSVQQRVKGKGWRVGGHRSSAYMANVTFEVQEGGRRRALREGRKNVHAFVRGTYFGPTLVAPEDLALHPAVCRLNYSLQRGGFYDVSSPNWKLVSSAEEVWLTISGVFARGVVYGVAR